MDIIAGNGHDDTNSNPGQVFVYFIPNSLSINHLKTEEKTKKNLDRLTGILNPGSSPLEPEVHETNK